MKTEIIKPPPHLEKYIRFFWTIDCSNISPEDNLFKVFARRFPRMVFQHNDGKSAIYHGKDFLPLAYLSGLNSRPYTCGIQPTVSATGVSFYPHAIKLFFGMDVFEMVNELPDIQNFVCSQLKDQIIDTSDERKRIKILIKFFTQRLEAGNSIDKVCETSWKMINHSSEEATLKNLQTFFNISEKQLERRFKYSIGYTPKQFLRITRFEKAVSLIQRAKVGRLSEIGYDLNYSDQSHFIREFKEFSNLTPTQYLRQQKIYEENSAIMVGK